MDKEVRGGLKVFYAGPAARVELQAVFQHARTSHLFSCLLLFFLSLLLPPSHLGSRNYPPSFKVRGKVSRMCSCVLLHDCRYVLGFAVIILMTRQEKRSRSSLALQLWEPQITSLTHTGCVFLKRRSISLWSTKSTWSATAHLHQKKNQSQRHKRLKTGWLFGWNINRACYFCCFWTNAVQKHHRRDF